MWKVYGLLDPRDGRVRYIGCTGRKLGTRLAAHLRSAEDRNGRDYNCARQRWLREIIDTDAVPIILEIERWPTKQEGWSAEQRWIEHLREQLVNETVGGGGVSGPSEDLRQRMSVAISKAQKHAWRKDDGTRRATIAAIGKQNWSKAVAASVAVRRGVPLTDDHKAAIRAHHRTPEFRRFMSERKKGTKLSPEAEQRRLAGLRAHFERKRQEFEALPKEMRELILKNRRQRNHERKMQCQRERRAAQKRKEADDI